MNMTPQQKTELNTRANKAADSLTALVGIGDTVQLRLLFREVCTELRAILDFAEALEDSP